MAWHDDWKKAPNGDLMMNPLMGFDTAAMPEGMAGFLRLSFALDASMRTDTVQIVLTEKQARELGSSILELADRLAASLAADKPAGPTN